MPTFEALQSGPVKSMPLEGRDALSFDADGLFGDRHWMVVEEGAHVAPGSDTGRVREPGHFVSLRKDKALATIVPHLVEGGIRLAAPDADITALSVPDVAENRRPVSVWDWHGEAVDQGQEVADWLSDRVGRRVRFVELSRERPRFVKGDPDLGLGIMGFADGYPLTVSSDVSVARLDAELGNTPSSQRRTRATLRLAGLALPPEAPEDAFPEDWVEEISVVVEGLRWRAERIRACGRCIETDRHPETGELIRNGSVLAALTKLKRRGRHADAKPGDGSDLFFTQNFIVVPPADMPKGAVITLHQGMEVNVRYSDHTNWVPLSVQ